MKKILLQLSKLAIELQETRHWLVNNDCTLEVPPELYNKLALALNFTKVPDIILVYNILKVRARKEAE